MPHDDTVDYLLEGGEAEGRTARRLQERIRGSDQRKHGEYGLCSKCRHFRVRVKTKGGYDHKEAWCAELPERFENLSADTPVKDCAVFWPAGAPTLREMMTEAKAIEKRDLLKESYL